MRLTPRTVTANRSRVGRTAATVRVGDAVLPTLVAVALGEDGPRNTRGKAGEAAGRVVAAAARQLIADRTRGGRGTVRGLIGGERTPQALTPSQLAAARSIVRFPAYSTRPVGIPLTKTPAEEPSREAAQVYERMMRQAASRLGPVRTARRGRGGRSWVRASWADVKRVVYGSSDVNLSFTGKMLADLRVFPSVESGFFRVAFGQPKVELASVKLDVGFETQRSARLALLHDRTRPFAGLTIPEQQMLADLFADLMLDKKRLYRLAAVVYRDSATGRFYRL